MRLDPLPIFSEVTRVMSIIVPRTMVEIKIEAPIRALQGRNKLQSLNIHKKFFNLFLISMFAVSSESCENWDIYQIWCFKNRTRFGRKISTRSGTLRKEPYQAERGLPDLEPL